MYIRCLWQCSSLRFLSDWIVRMPGRSRGYLDEPTIARLAGRSLNVFIRRLGGGWRFIVLGGRPCLYPAYLLALDHDVGPPSTPSMLAPVESTGLAT